MPKFISVVKFKVKTGEEQNFIEAMRKFQLPDGVIYRKIINTGKAFQLLRKLKNLKIQKILFLQKKLIKLSSSMRNYPLNIKTQRFIIIFL